MTRQHTDTEPGQHDGVPAEPHLMITLNGDGTADVDGKPVESVHDDLRAAALALAAGTAKQLGRPVRATAVEPGARYELLVHPDGTTTAPPPATGASAADQSPRRPPWWPWRRPAKREP